MSLSDLDSQFFDLVAGDETKEFRYLLRNYEVDNNSDQICRERKTKVVWSLMRCHSFTSNKWHSLPLLCPRSWIVHSASQELHHEYNYITNFTEQKYLLLPYKQIKIMKKN